MQKNLKIPPQNIEAEVSVLGSCMLDNFAIAKITDIIDPEDFYHPQNKIIYSALLTLFEKGEPIDIITVSSLLKKQNKLKNTGGTEYLASLINKVPTAAHVEDYAKIVKEKSVRRSLIHASSQINETAFDKEDFEELLDEVEMRIFGISERSRPKRFVHIKGEIIKAHERIEKLHQGGVIRGTPTYFKGLDDLLSGFQKSDLIILGARPSFGKTSLALDFARNVATHGGSVGIFSIEMSREQVVDRLIASQAKIPLWRMRTGRLTETERSLISQAYDELSDTNIFIDDSPSPTVLQMRSAARRLQLEQGVDLLIVDYLQLTRAQSSNMTMVHQITEVSRGLKALARELNVPVLALSQLSRDVDKRDVKIPRLSDLRESGCVSGDTLITLADSGEQIKIKDLAERKISAKVFAVDDDYKIKPFTLKKAFYSGKKKIYELKTRTGRSIKASANHPFLKIGGWARLENLSIGDTIGLPSILKSEKTDNELSRDEIILLAHLIGDGCILPKQPYHYTSADLENIECVKKSAKKLFNIESRLVRQKNWYHLYLTSPYKLTHGKKHPITKWFEKLKMDRVRSYEKLVPESVFKCSDKYIALFLRHLWSTDGNISWKKIKNRSLAGNIYYSTSSEKLGKQVQHLLLRLGIQSTLKDVPSNKGYRMMYHIYVQGVENQKLFLENVSSVGERGKIGKDIYKEIKAIKSNPNTGMLPKETWDTWIKPAKEKAGISWRDFSKRIQTSYCGTSIFKSGIGKERMERICTALKTKLLITKTGREFSELLQNLANSNVYWDTIISITPLKTQDVYDAEIEGSHNFVANDIIIHNSLEQDADVVLFIYRKDRERIDLSPEEQNIAEIIISKHRNGPLGSVKLRFDAELVSFHTIEKYREQSEEEF